MVKGNHEVYVLGDVQRAKSSPSSLAATRWTRRELEIDPGDPGAGKYEAYLRAAPTSVELDQHLFIHGSPVDHTFSYLFPPGMKDDAQLVADCFARLGGVSFQVHTHMPVVHHAGQDAATPTGSETRLAIQPPTMVNVGSVGNPRDYDYRACYVIVDACESSVTYHRVDYPVKETARKIQAIPELDDRLAKRLYKGR